MWEYLEMWGGGGSWLSHGVGPHDRIRVLVREDLTLFPRQTAEHKKPATCKPRRRLSPETESASTLFFVLFCFLSFCLLRATPVAYGGSQARGLIRAIAYARATAIRDLSHVCHLHHSSQHCWILNPLSKARDRTLNLMVPSQIR